MPRGAGGKVWDCSRLTRLLVTSKVMTSKRGIPGGSVNDPVYVCVCDHLNCKPLTAGILFSLLCSQTIYHYTRQAVSAKLAFSRCKKHWKKLQTRILVHLGLYWFSLGLWPSHTIEVQVWLDQQRSWKGFYFLYFFYHPKTVCYSFYQHLLPNKRCFPRGHSGKEPTRQCRRCKRLRCGPGVRKIPWSRT